MADHMLQFPGRSSSALQPQNNAAREPLPPQRAAAPWPARYRGLFLIRSDGTQGESPTPAVPRQTSTISQTRMIVAQVEHEIASLAAREQAQRLGRVRPMPPASELRDPHRDTPWTVLARLLRSLLRR